MDTLVPTLNQLKQNAKLINQALKDLGHPLTHSTSLNVASRGFGFKDYNTAKAQLSMVTRHDAFVGVSGSALPFQSPPILKMGAVDPSLSPEQGYSFSSRSAFLGGDATLSTLLNIAKGYLLGQDVPGAIPPKDSREYGAAIFVPNTLVPNTHDRLDTLPFAPTMIVDRLRKFATVDADKYDSESLHILIDTHRKFGITRLALHSVQPLPQSILEACQRNQIKIYTRGTLGAAYLEELEQTKDRPMREETLVPFDEFAEMVHACGLPRNEAHHLAKWYHDLNGGWIDYSVLIPGVIFEEGDTFELYQKTLYGLFMNTVCDQIGGNAKQAWEDYVEGGTWDDDAEKMFKSGGIFSGKIAAALGLSYDTAIEYFNALRKRA